MEVFSKYRAKLAEGPTYDKELNKLFWVDIDGMKIIIKGLEDGNEKIINAGDLVSSLCVIDENRIIATVRHSFVIFDLVTGERKVIASVETDIQENRFNDGKCDRLGRYWAGTMNMNKDKPTGNLYKLEGNKVMKMVEGLTISNGLAWDLDKKKMYLIDTPTRKVFAFDFDLSRGEIYNKTIAIDFGSEPGNPDGMTIDEEGYLWVAHWGGGKVSRWTPEGKKVDEIKLPVTYVSSVTFGGLEMNELFITSAQKEGEPLSGNVFHVKVNVKGVENYRFRYE